MKGHGWGRGVVLLAGVAGLIGAVFGCASGKDKEPIAQVVTPTEKLQVRVFDGWSTRQMKGSVYLKFEPVEGWTFLRVPTAQTSAGSLVHGRSSPNFWETTFRPIDAQYRLATGTVTINAYWEMGGPGGARRAGRTVLVIAVSENLAPTVMSLVSEEKPLVEGGAGK